MNPTPVATRGSLDGISFRPIQPADMDFLRRLYRSTREDELARTPWSEPEKSAFIAMQFQAQHDYYQQHYGAAAFEVIALHGTPIGRRYLEERPAEVRLIDIALLPEHRNRGIGGALLADLLARAEATGKPIRLHVEPFNPAMRLYRRLGFTLLEERGVYHFMEWHPPAP